MKILFLHGWNSIPGGVKPSYLMQHGHDVLNPALSDDDWDDALRTAQTEFDRHRPDVIVGSSRGGAVAMNLDSGSTPLVLLCPAWRRWGSVKKVRPGTVILHSEADDVIPIGDSRELLRASALPETALIVVGNDHRLADPEPLAAMLEACGDAAWSPKTDDVVRAVVRKAAVFGLFCDHRMHEILVLIPDVSWIASFASCEQVAVAGDELEVKVVGIDRERRKIAGSLRALHPESDPWHGVWHLAVGDVLDATVVRWVEHADRCGNAGGYLLALRPAAYVMLCGHQHDRFRNGDHVAVEVATIDARVRQVTVRLVS